MSYFSHVRPRIGPATVAVVLLLAALLWSGIKGAFADHSSDVIHACLKNGKLDVVATPSDCKNNETAITLAGEAAISTLQAENAALQTQIDELAGEVDALQSLLQHVSRDGNDLYITGANLHVVNGTGTTDGTPNALGNIIIGYNEPRVHGSNDRSGSHMLVVGEKHNYSSFGGIVVGFHNTTSGDYASVSGGFHNTTSGDYASVSGGYLNTASGHAASVSGGLYNTASGLHASVSGGQYNTASGGAASVSGGTSNTASQYDASVSGGGGNTASGYRASVSGGSSNTASGNDASVSGGWNNHANSNYQHLP